MDKVFFLLIKFRLCTVCNTEFLGLFFSYKCMHLQSSFVYFSTLCIFETLGPEGANGRKDFADIYPSPIRPDYLIPIL